jgi:flagellar basal-body rod protein FlgB
MDWSNSAPFGAIKQRPTWLDQRQQVLARNAANADTPGYVPRDLEQPRFPGSTPDFRALSLATTTPAHLSGAERRKAHFREQMHPDTDPSPNGNAVDLEQQMAKISETNISHKTASQLYRKYLGMIRLASTARG